MSNTLVQEGNANYITSNRAAQLSGYSQDYVGQLCRAGSIECKRVSGEWQVSLQSLLTYKKRFNSVVEETSAKVTQETPGSLQTGIDVESGHQDSIIEDGKTYISSSDAAKHTGYSQDYVGQLARSGAVLAKKVGRRWFIEKTALEKHKKHNDGLLAALQADVAGTKAVEPSEDVKEVDSKGAISDPSPKGLGNSIPIVTYKRDDGSLVPGAAEAEDDGPLGQHSPEVKTMPTIQTVLPRRDLRTVVASKKGMAIPKSKIATKRSSSLMAKILLFLILTASLSVIAISLLMPSLLEQYTTAITEPNLDRIESTHIGRSIIDLFNSHTLYKKDSL